MVELPPHVRRVVARGREYFYFQRNRGAALEGPRIALPSNVNSIEFWQGYRAALGQVEERTTGRTFNDLIAAYRVAPEFTNRAPATQLDYSRYLNIIKEAWGPLLVSGVRPKHVLTLRDAWAATPVSANMLVSIARLLFNWGLPREFSETNPCLAIPKLETEEGGARPWPVWAYDLIRSHAAEGIRRAVWLARYTGQRQADVLRMSKADLDDGGIKVKQQKTDKELWIPLHADLKEEMRSWEVLPPWIFVLNAKGEPYSPDRFRAAWSQTMMSTPAGRIRTEGYTFHGIRASSVVSLREVGCGDRDIESITGMTSAMITRYSRFADQRQLAKAAIHRLERNKS